MCEILYKSPQFSVRIESFVFRAQDGLTAVPNPPIDQERLNAFMLSNPRVDPAIADNDGDKPSAATLYLKQFVVYLCDLVKAIEFIALLIARTVCRLKFQTHARKIWQCLLLMEIYESLNPLVARPAGDLDEAIDHALNFPGQYALPVTSDTNYGSMNSMGGSGMTKAAPWPGFILNHANTSRQHMDDFVEFDLTVLLHGATEDELPPDLSDPNSLPIFSAGATLTPIPLYPAISYVRPPIPQFSLQQNAQ